MVNKAAPFEEARAESAGTENMFTIAKTDCHFEREPLQAPFGFKGHALTELWQSVAGLRSTDGRVGVGVGTQSVLWSDASVFTQYAEAAGNSLMFQLTAFALQQGAGRTYGRPEEMIEQLQPEVLTHGYRVTGHKDLRPTFALNALVAVDNAAWQLFAAASAQPSFDALTAQYRGALRHRHRQLGVIPLISYGVAVDDAVALARRGHFVLKIKIGSDPAGDGSQDKMLEWDCRRMSELHAGLRELTTPHTTNGRIAYYLDANGRYDSRARLERLLEHCARIGALEQIVLLEEPFPEDYECDVRGLPVRLAADESAHSVEDVVSRIEAGYGAIALKPVAKTLSLSLRMAAAAEARGVPCFCADLTVNPTLVEWGKNVAARLAPIPGLKLGVLETNGAQNYRDWARLQSYHPAADASWVEPRAGLFELDEDFYARSGGIFLASPHYAGLVPAVAGP